MTAAEKMYSIKLVENDFPGLSVCELQRWLECPGLAVCRKKKPVCQNVSRFVITLIITVTCLECIESSNTYIVIHVDGRKCYEQKVSEVLSSVRTCMSTETVLFLPQLTSHWNSFPNLMILKDFVTG
ncbi:hypothetical protein ACJMK2_043075 [Sinanodonta woodiana]|uniref:Uncharacterized protein n=1 Tax=Sinanodonta woodiana TaxID=1069815 RepID=A0ABD3VXI3_SINWO